MITTRLRIFVKFYILMNIIQNMEFKGKVVIGKCSTLNIAL